MSNHIRVSIPRMKADGDDLHAEIEKIPQFVNELQGAMNDLGRCWEGPAWITFQQQVNSDIENMMSVYEWLRKVVEALSEAEKAYGDCEKSSYDCVDRIRI